MTLLEQTEPQPSAPVNRIVHLQTFLLDHGLLALFLIVIFEADLSMVVAGVLAHTALLPLDGAMLVGAAGMFLGDSAWFFAGRRFRGPIRESRLYRRVGPLIEQEAKRFGPWQLLAARVIYGTRNMSMVFWGQYGLPFRRFALFNALSCMLGAVGFALLGYAIGQGSDALVGRVHRIEQWLLGGLVLAVIVVLVISRFFRWELGRVGITRTPPPTPGGD